MKVSDYAAHDGLGLAALIKGGEVSAREVAEAAIAAAEGVNPALNCVLEVFHDKLDSLSSSPETADRDAPIFHGVPMMLKDIGAAEASRKQEMASLLTKGRVAKETSNLTKRFQEAGLVNLGRTSLPEFGLASANSVSDIHGTTVNPWHTDYMSGSSSGGAGAAVASGIVPIAHASDIGGSTRHPAGICGAVGLKASRGRTSLGPARSDFPLGTLNEFAITRTVRDSAALMDAIEGPGFGEARIVEKLTRPLLDNVFEVQAGVAIKPGEAQLKVAMWDASFCTSISCDPEVAKTVSDTANTLAAMGADIIKDRPGFDFDMVVEADTLALGAHGAMNMSRLAADVGFSLEDANISPIVTQMIKNANEQTAMDLAVALDQYNLIRRQVSEFFETYDLLVVPVISCQTELASLHALEISSMESDSWMHHYQYLVPFNISGNPAISLPLAMSSSNMPIGVQLVARHGNEELLYRASAALEIWIVRSACHWGKPECPCPSTRK